jgi:hypothetical protein
MLFLELHLFIPPILYSEALGRFLCKKLHQQGKVTEFVFGKDKVLHAKKDSSPVSIVNQKTAVKFGGGYLEKAGIGHAEEAFGGLTEAKCLPNGPENILVVCICHTCHSHRRVSSPMKNSR